MKYRWILLFGLLIISNMTQIDAETDTRIVFLGDSITAGFARNPSYVSLLPNYGLPWNETGTNLINAAAPGYSAADLYNSADDFNKKIVDNKPHYVIINLGLSDSTFLTKDQFELVYQGIINKILTVPSVLNIFLVKFSWIKMDEDERRVAESFLEVIENTSIEYNLPLVDLYTPMIGEIKMLYDGVHPNESGANFIAGLIHKAFSDLISIQEAINTSNSETENNHSNNAEAVFNWTPIFLLVLVLKHRQIYSRI
ncbi:MAG: SGNH/GDSL hydrolase family protein [Candidatus Heimdallarchaeota archaeon]|nr:SGNH/GDSL hydrolase family protein [Candidatus Heimdallarchaeota archaeon]